MNTEITINPHLSLHYAAFYVLRLNNCFPGKIKFSHEPFKSLNEGRRTCLSFILKKNDKDCKIAIDFHDANSVDYSVLKWSDTYAKINYHHIETIEDLSNNRVNQSEFIYNKLKLLVTPPSFGINIYTLFEFLSFTAKIFISQNLSLVTKKTILLAALRMVIKKKPLKDYYPKNSNQKYIFQLNSL